MTDLHVEGMPGEAVATLLIVAELYLRAYAQAAIDAKAAVIVGEERRRASAAW
jgi:hypothetical protein